MSHYLLRFHQGGYVYRTEAETLDHVREITKCTSERFWQLALTELADNGITRNVGWWTIVDTQHKGN